jgi:glucokinase
VEPGHFHGRAGQENLNELASGPGLVRCAKRRIAAGEKSVLQEYDGDFDTPELLAAADAGDPVATATLEAGRNGIAGLLMTVLFAVAPDAIVLAGGLCTESRWFVDPLREKVKRWMPIPELAEIPIERAQLWDRAVLYGAATLVSRTGN